jgi:hypothetical protein
MKPQDLVVAAKLLSSESGISFAALAQSLG